MPSAVEWSVPGILVLLLPSQNDEKFLRAFSVCREASTSRFVGKKKMLRRKERKQLLAV
jgi:hypothetical protein